MVLGAVLRKYLGPRLETFLEALFVDFVDFVDNTPFIFDFRSNSIVFGHVQQVNFRRCQVQTNEVHWFRSSSFGHVN